jgi:oxygen-independent coproporphyrinogen-3 oxidase
LFKKAAVRDVYEQNALAQVQFDTVFFGGGTPSLLWREIAEIIAAVASVGALNAEAEITVECNPDDVHREMLDTLSAAGVNRLSLGVQSLDDATLRHLGRRHDAATALTAVRLAAQAGFTNISADIILGIPCQSVAEIRRTVETLTELPLTHIAAYMYEADKTLPDDETAELYLQTVELLDRRGFAQYEISNFAREGFQCRHNLKYWLCHEYIGIGPGAHSYFGGKRFAGTESLPSWTQYTTDNHPDSSRERLMLGLRLNSGIIADDAVLERAKAIPQEYLLIKDRNLSLTAKGFLISNTIIAELLL